MFERYKNLGMNSNVRAFEIGPTSIDVQFADGSIYTYTYVSAGEARVEEMKRLASAGKGLNSYIMKYAKTAYARKK